MHSANGGKRSRLELENTRPPGIRVAFFLREAQRSKGSAALQRRSPASSLISEPCSGPTDTPTLIPRLLDHLPDSCRPACRRLLPSWLVIVAFLCCGQRALAGPVSFRNDV